MFVTHNRRDLILLHDAWRRWTAAWGLDMPHAGILIILQRVALPVLTEAIHAHVDTAPLTNELYEWV